MFYNQGEFYCINGCFRYPINMNRILNLLNELPEINNIDEVVYYDIHPNQFLYESVMNSRYKIRKGDLSSLSTKTLLSIDFYYFDLSCQLQMEFFDDLYYGLSLVYNYEDKMSSQQDRLLKEMFYRNLRPIYGNDGHEKGAFSLEQISKNDYDLFDNNFYICDNIYQKLGNHVGQIKNSKTLKGCGVYFPKQNESISQTLFSAFLKIIARE